MLNSMHNDEEIALLSPPPPSPPPPPSQRHQSMPPRNVYKWAFVGREIIFLLIGFCVGWLVFSRRNLHSSVADLKLAKTPIPLNFLVVGDWGREGLYNQSQVAIQMGRIGEELGIQFVLSTGDNFYETGLTGVDDPLFTRSFTNIYTAPSLQTTWYAVLGNHDYMGDAIAQVSEEITKRDPRWSCRREFRLHRSLCGSSDTEACKSTVDFFFIDTTPFIDEYWEPNETRSFDWRGLLSRKEQLKIQLRNLAQKLESSRATWKIIVGHHTIRSVGHHGDSPELLNQVLPILEEHRVDLYINGHDHNLQHIKRRDSPIHFITSGGGSKAWTELRPITEESGLQFAYDGQGFLAVSIEPNSILLKFYDVFGNILRSSILEK